ncbi:MAG: ABC transporter substrate-binding protein [Actinomycetota bacterium]|nr:ABC transporter substrate-binding protein [Actinomycetota bacterium]
MPELSGSTGSLPPVSRRAALKALGGVAGLAAVPSALTACSSSKKKKGSGKTQGAVKGGSITFGSNYSDAAPKAAFAALCTAATAKTTTKIRINTTDHNTFQNNISNYLQGTPDDLATWFAGYRMQFFAAQNLLTPLDDVWDKIGGTFNDAARNLSKGLDGHYYFVPLYNYPWVVFYNKSVFASKGYTVPTKWDEFVALAKQMQKDGLVPLAFADKDGWPALGTFDIINLRVNGYEYHIKLMKHEVPWTDKGVAAVFDQWREILPYAQKGATGRIWQDAAKALENKQAGMMFQGSNQVAANYAPAHLTDLDFFVYPVINEQYGTDFMDAPTDGFMLPKKAKNQGAAKAVLEYIGAAEAESTFLKTDQWDVGLANGLVAPSYNDIQKKAVAEIGKCKNVAQFMDRDTVPDMATAMIKLIQGFIDDPSSSNVSSLQKSAESQAKTIFA